jgi:hypothetical protein
MRHRVDPGAADLLDRLAHADGINIGDAESAPTTTGMSYFLPLPSTTLVNRNARRLFSGMPPTNCQRTSGCNSVSLSIVRSIRVTSPAASSAARCCWKSSAGPLVLPPERAALVGLIEHGVTSCSSATPR